MEETETNDPQDRAGFSPDMAGQDPVQQEVRADSVFSALLAFAMAHGKAFGTNGKRSDAMRFDLTTHSVSLGNVFLVCRGKVVAPLLETASVRIDMSGLPWLSPADRELDPVSLFDEHYLSRPGGSDRYMAGNFPAKAVDDMTDEEVARGVPRSEARVRLEAWILCAAIDGTLEKYVTGQPGWRDGDSWWSPGRDRPACVGRDLVVKTDWWMHAGDPQYGLRCVDGTRHALTRGNAEVAVLSHHLLSDREMRTLQMAEALRSTLASLADAAFRMQLRTGRYDCDPVMAEANRIFRYIDRG